MWNSSSAEEKQPYERKAAKLKEKYDKVGGCASLARAAPSIRSPAGSQLTSCPAQDIIAYRTKGKVEESAAAADDDDEDEEEEEEGEDDDDDDDDDD